MTSMPNWKWITFCPEVGIRHLDAANSIRMLHKNSAWVFAAFEGLSSGAVNSWRLQDALLFDCNFGRKAATGFLTPFLRPWLPRFSGPGLPAKFPTFWGSRSWGLLRFYSCTASCQKLTVILKTYFRSQSGDGGESWTLDSIIAWAFR